MRGRRWRYSPDTDDSARGEFAWQFLSNALHRERARLPRHPGDVYSLSFAPDGLRMATACRDGKVRIWDWRRRTLLTELGDHQGEANVVAFSPDGSLLASGDDAGRVVIRDGATYSLRRVLEPEPGTDVSEIMGILFSPDGTRLYVGAGKTVQAWELATGTKLAQAHDHLKYVRSIALSPEGELLVTVGADLKLRQSDDLRARESALDKDTYCAAVFSADGRHLVASGKSGALEVYDLVANKRVARVRNNFATGARRLSATSDGRNLLAAGEDRHIEVFEVGTWAQQAVLK
jgi:WD40 repeat protein